jgi:nucleoside-diphosphate-sugar epimerase
VFHLAGILSGQGEVDFELCISVNLDGTRNVLEALRETSKKVSKTMLNIIVIV